ncbi:hypothetical protein [Sphingomonas radiodurans]|uniref:hypothetical protein n=1 Tax=Sphingomonas radiodurans TaxID=2890321 RepID=UPI001E2A4162|nr:hypothetical protein [Sphingomonas radiodurans]WBH17389.1 hypothetical protein LLW23_04580 [Sphingomonas radiodurans]
MVFDLRAALLRKAEVETARLVDFDFRLRARTMRLLAARLGLDPDALVAEIVRGGDAAILAALSEQTGRDAGALNREFQECAAEARAQLIAERGDPTPHRLA